MQIKVRGLSLRKGGELCSPHPKKTIPFQIISFSSWGLSNKLLFPPSFSPRTMHNNSMQSERAYKPPLCSEVVQFCLQITVGGRCFLRDEAKTQRQDAGPQTHCIFPRCYHLAGGSVVVA